MYQAQPPGTFPPLPTLCPPWARLLFHTSLSLSSPETDLL